MNDILDVLPRDILPEEGGFIIPEATKQQKEEIESENRDEKLSLQALEL